MSLSDFEGRRTGPGRERRPPRTHPQIIRGAAHNSSGRVRHPPGRTGCMVPKAPIRPLSLDRREAAWLSRWTNLASFVSEHGHVPTESSSGSDWERRLAGWLRYQRRRAQRGVMPLWQRALLEQVPQFEWDPAGDRWWAQYARLRRFLESERCMPRYRASNRDERALAAWVHKQRYLHRRDQLSAHRVAALRRLPFRIV